VDVPARWGEVLEALRRIAGVALLTVDADGRTAAAAGVPDLCTLLAAAPEGAARCAASCGRQAAIAREQNRACYYRCHAGLQCFATPLRVGGGAAGSILGGRTLERAGDVAGIEALAAELALPPDAARRAVGNLALANSRLLARACELATLTADALFTGERQLAQARTRIALLTSLLALGADFARERDPHEVHATILDAAAILFDVRGACLLVHDPGSGIFRLRTFFGAPAGPLPPSGIGADSPLLAPVLRERRPAFTQDRGALAAQGFAAGVRRLALFPLLAGERVLGVLAIVDTELGEDEAALLEAFCHQAALALQNALLRDELARRSRELERASRLRGRLTPLHEWEDVIEAVFDEATQLAGARESSLMLLDRGRGTLRVTQARGEHAAVLRAVSVPAGSGIAGRVALEGTPLLLADVELDGRLARPRRQRYRTASCLVVPLKIEERVIGVINLADKAADAPFSPEDLEAVLAVTVQASCALERSALRRRTRRLAALAATDALTGLGNRRLLEMRLREECDRSRRHGTPLAAALFDIDDFKSFNDREGHPAGDRLLAAVAHAIRDRVRSVDVVARYGGEEFVVLFPQTGPTEALALAERIRGTVEGAAFRLPGPPPAGGVTVSCGVAALGAEVPDAAALLAAADRALYAAKARGKNCVAAAEG
jgi:diguanylate cyclase (GGDEF)-like protein